MKKLIFLHIPKCGGSTIRDKIIQRYSARGRVFKLYNDNPQQDYYTPRTLTKFLLEGGGLPKTVNSIIGHISFEELSLLIDMKEWEIFSVVRNPIDRAISDLNYMRINRNHRGNNHAMKVTENSLYNYLCSLDGALQTKFLGGARNIENVKVYKLENYLEALLDVGVIDSLDDEVKIKNVTVDKMVDKGVKVDLFSKDMMSESNLKELKSLYAEDYDLYESAV